MNMATLSNSKVELCVGFNTGQILVHDPFFKSITVQINFAVYNFSSSRHVLINFLILVQMTVANTKVTSIKWVPGSKTHFIAAHTNGAIYVYDKTRTEERIPPFTDDRSK